MKWIYFIYLFKFCFDIGTNKQNVSAWLHTFRVIIECSGRLLYEYGGLVITFFPKKVNDLSVTSQHVQDPNWPLVSYPPFARSLHLSTHYYYISLICILVSFGKNFNNCPYPQHGSSMSFISGKH